MTLITYPVRAHFADGVLEEALRSELEAHQLDAPLVLGEEDEIGSEFTERLFSSFPRGFNPKHYPIAKGTSKAEAASEVRSMARRKKPNVLIAYGSARSIEYARKCRRELQQETSSDKLIELFAIPGVDGLPGPCRKGYQADDVPSDIAVRIGLPSILICDPTLIMSAEPAKCAKAAVTILVQCLEAYLSSAFNPLADGMALDGLQRTSVVLPHLSEETVEMRRELMAAAFNAMLCQQKGAGPAQMIGEALQASRSGDFDAKLAAGILLPGVLRALTFNDERRDVVRRLLAIDEQTHLPEGVAELVKETHVPQTLSALGATRENLDRVARELSIGLTLPEHATDGDVMKIMEDVF